MNKFEAIIEVMKSWETSELVQAWNQRCDDYHEGDSYIEYMDSFNEMFYGKEPLDIADMMTNARFYSGDEYFSFNAHGNLVSYSDLDDYDCPFEWYDMAEYMSDNGDADTREVDSDKLADFFVLFVSEKTDIDEETIAKKVDTMIEETTFDLLTDDWDILYDTFMEEYNN